ncbi:TRAP transporter substrate-binding protein DctP [Anaeromyxobacter sp. Fw109-5]|uniref:TRAP transporter substrate-binding protein n=1 Tax=Anaeromyxobacter sp. (strain Fw109-5) TaxID=404589 RepID=UPI0000ED7800|nr:TRAP transporter substrate-binding protein DctP [Anaeromyxobacter sp. Fw109-5]ABS24655.1 TRAP dicarboxylate transporter- DctP subunit [Anaeromyxobacter sp. Fw109-5]
MKKLLLAALFAALATTARAQTVTLKLGTLAPQGSTWHDILREMGQKWEQASGGKVKLRIYAGGAQGSEGDMVRKMGIGQLQAAAISNVGMHDVIPEPQALSVPFLFQSEAQMECAFEKVRPRIEQALEKRGLVALQWSRIGAIHLFCDSPFKTPAEVSRAKIWAWEGDPKSVEAFRAAGLQPVVLSANDMYPSLQTGMIDCVPNVPLYVLTARLFEKANHMVDVSWAYMIGATIVRKDAWEKIPADVRPKLLEIAQSLGRKVDDEVRRLNTDAVTAMQKQGLQVVKVDPGPWRQAMEKSWTVVRGGVVPAEFFDAVKSARDACPAK